MPISNENNKKQEMGYHGSNMHGYSYTKKEAKLDRYAGEGTEQKQNKPKNNL